MHEKECCPSPEHSSKKISVVITAHDRRNYIERAINSAMNQTFPMESYEVIVVKNYEDPRIDKVITQNCLESIVVPKDSIVGYDLALAIERSSGEIISFLDDDDVFSEDKLKIVWETFNRENVSYVKNEVFFQDDEDKLITRDSRQEISADHMMNGRDLIHKIAYLNRVKAGFNLSSISIKRDTISEEVLDFLKNRLIHSTDTFFFCCGLNSGMGIFLISKRLTGYRINQSTSKKLGHDKESILRKIAFWDSLLGAYGDFSNFFGGISNEYLKTRTCSQKLAREISKIEIGLSKSRDFSVWSCFHRALKTRDVLLMYDLLRFFKTKITHS